MKRLTFILLFFTTSAFGQQNFPVIVDTLMPSGSIDTKHMLEGGFGLIGFSSNRNVFNLTEQDELFDLHIRKWVLFRGSVEKSNNNYTESNEFEIPPNEHPPPPPSVFNPYLNFEIGNELKVIVDTTQIVALAEYVDNSEIRLYNSTSSYQELYDTEIDFLGKYYKQSQNQIKGYPIQIINLTDSIIEIETKEGWIYMIQEAIDSLGNWKPIEYLDFRAICGNSYDQEYLLPNEYFISKIYKYSGTYHTRIRVKFSTNKRIYFSNEFHGAINYSQFEVPEFISSEPLEKQNARFLKSR